MDTIDKIFSSKKGILAADESENTMNKRLEFVGVKPTLENRNKWREILIETKNIENYISGIILFEETLNHKVGDTSYTDFLHAKGILVGIKVDQGLEKVGQDGFYTKGLEGLDLRIDNFKQKGVTFTKWRSVYQIKNNSLDEELMKRNNSDLVKYAKIVLEKELTPILEPELLRTKGYDTEIGQKIHQKILVSLISNLKEQQIPFDKIIIKTNFSAGGLDSELLSEQVCKDTMRTLKTLPSNLGGLVFLSGGFNTEDSIEYLRLVSRDAKEKGIGFPISFSYGRALQQNALKIWKGPENNEAKVKEILSRDFKATSEALI